MILFISKYYIHVLMVCADHNSFDLPVLDVLYVVSFFYVMTLDFVVSKSFLLIILYGE
jgi:hypothetical protein